MPEPRYTSEEFVRRGTAIYEHGVRSRLQAGDDGKFAAIAIETGAYEIDSDDFTATERLLARHPGAQIWLVRIGHRAAYRFGSGRTHNAA